MQLQMLINISISVKDLDIVFIDTIYLYRRLLPAFDPHSATLTHATGTRLTVALGTHLEVRLRLRLQLHLYLQLPPLYFSASLLLWLALLLVMLISFRR